MESLFLLGLLRMILSDLFYRLSWCFDDDTVWFILSFVHWTVVNTDTWFNVLYTHRQQYSSTQWSKCCGLTNHSQVSSQQISNHCDRVQHYCQLWYKKKILMLFFDLLIRDTPGNDLFRTMTAAYVQEDVQVKEIKKRNQLTSIMYCWGLVFKQIPLEQKRCLWPRL